MWQLRHEGSPQAVKNLSAEQIVEGLRDGLIEPTDEVLAPGETNWQAVENHPQFAEVAEDLDPPRPIRHDQETHIDMNALIDVCLVLLIFFILTTSYAHTVQKLVPLPTVQTKEGKTYRIVKADEVKNRMIRILATRDSAGKLSLRIENHPVQVLKEDGKTLDMDKLRDDIKTYVRGGADRKTEVLLDARDISWGTVVAIQDAAKAAGVQTIHHVIKK